MGSLQLVCTLRYIGYEENYIRTAGSGRDSMRIVQGSFMYMPLPALLSKF